MDRAELQELQRPIKERYREDPERALVTLSAEGTLDDQGVACSVATGQAASSNPVSNVNVLPFAFIGGVPATVRFAGLAPSFVGLYQVNIEVPANAPVGDDPLQLISNGVASNPVTISIGR